MIVMALAITSVASAITIDTVSVGNINNAADSTGYGAVGYGYNIGTTEVTTTHYAAFLNAVAKTDTYGLYNSFMGDDVLGGITKSGGSGSFNYTVKSGYENKPVNYVSFWDATRFANWMNNGQGSASTELGSYTLTSVGISANTVTRNGGANWVVASGNEWYKAAYYDPNQGGAGVGGYWLYPTQSNTITTTDANYYAEDPNSVETFGTTASVIADVTFGKASAYGTKGQGGNLTEWNEVTFGDAFRGGAGWLLVHRRVPTGVVDLP